MVFIIMVEQPVEHLHITVVGESEVTDASCLLLFHEEVEQSVVDESPVELIHTAAADAVHQVVVDIVDLQPLKRAFIHPLALIEAERPLVRHLRGDIILITGMTLQGDTCSLFRTTVCGCCVKIIHTMGEGIVNQLVHILLITG